MKKFNNYIYAFTRDYITSRVKVGSANNWKRRLWKANHSEWNCGEKWHCLAILDMATYKILMGTDGQNLEESTELFKLSETQAEFLYKKKRGLALFIIGSNRIFVRFDIFPIEFEYFGKGGGR